MKGLQKAGGFAALYLAAAYLAAIPFYLLYANLSSIGDPVQKVSALATHQGGIYLMNLIAYVFFGLGLAVLAVALKEKVKGDGEVMMKVAAPIALIWSGLLIASGMISNVGMDSVVVLFSKDPAGAAALWTAVDLVASGLSGNGEIVGSTWMLLVSVAALRAGVLPKTLNFLGLVVAALGLASVIPGLKDLALLFGLVQIPWFIWLGVVLLRDTREKAAGIH